MAIKISKEMGIIITGFLLLIVISIAFALSVKYHKPLRVEEIIRVYDGDTFYVNLKEVHSLLGENIGIRIKGIDTPEMRGSDSCVKEMAIEARDFLEKCLRNGKKIKLDNYERGKYFRILADVYVDNDNIADKLIEYGYAVPYEGGTRHEWTCQDKKLIYR